MVIAEDASHARMIGATVCCLGVDQIQNSEDEKQIKSELFVHS